MPKQCVVTGCIIYESKISLKEQGISLHHFPISRTDHINAWLAKIKTTGRVKEGFLPTRHSLICSENFDESDFCFQNFTGKYTKDNINSGGI